MSSEILAAIITSGVSLIGTVITVLAASSRTNKKIEVHQAVTDTEIKELTREVREHNGFAQRVPILEERVKVINHRLDDLEKKGA